MERYFYGILGTLCLGLTIFIIVILPNQVGIEWDEVKGSLFFLLIVLGLTVGIGLLKSAVDPIDDDITESLW